MNFVSIDGDIISAKFNKKNEYESCAFTIVHQTRGYNNFFSCKALNPVLVNIVKTLRKNDRIVVSGMLKYYHFRKKNTSFIGVEIIANGIYPIVEQKPNPYFTLKQFGSIELPQDDKDENEDIDYSGILDISDYNEKNNNE